MTDLLELGTAASSPFAQRVVQSRFVCVEEAQRDSIQVYHGRSSKPKSANALLALVLIFVGGYYNDHGILIGAGMILTSVAGIAYLAYELMRKQRVFILDDAFAVESRFSSQVELIQWTDVTKLYCVDRTTRIRTHLLFIPVASSEHHQGQIRMVLADGRQVVISNRIQNFSEMARGIISRTTAVQLVPAAHFVIEEDGTLDFDKFGLSIDGLVYKRKLIRWSEMQQVALNGRGVLLFQTGRWFGSPRFNIEAIPNVSLLLEMLAILGAPCVHEA